MNYHAIYHRPKQNYAYAYDKKTIHLRIRTAKDEVERAEVISEILITGLLVVVAET